MDPVTTAIGAALLAGVVKSAGAVAEKTIVEGYDALKALIQRKFGAGSSVSKAIDSVEAKPDFVSCQQVLSEEITASKADQDPEILKAAQNLLEHVKANPGGSSYIQQASGTGIAQAQDYSTASVNMGMRQALSHQASKVTPISRRKVGSMEEQPAKRRSEQATGTGPRAQTQNLSAATVNAYQHIQPQAIDEATLADSQRLLSTLPTAGNIPSISALPRGSRMPFTRNPLFVGRQHDLMHLAKALKGEGDDSATATAAIGQIAAVSGLGGIGKTQLAVEFVHRYGRYFQGGVFWLSFADPNGVSAEISTCGSPAYLNLHPDYNSLPLDDQVKLVLAAWSSPLPRLLVLDNCEDQDLLARWRPPTGGCSVLVTSRRSQWDAALGVHSLPLGVLSPGESIFLLRKHRPDLSANDPNLAAIAEELDGLPLALHLAGSFLARYRYVVTPPEYLQELRGQGLLGHASLEGKGTNYSPTDHELNVYRTFALSYERLDASDSNDALAIKLLIRASYFAWGLPIPRELLVETVKLQGDEPDIKLHAEDALSRLVDLGLLETEEDGTLRLYRLLAIFVRDVADKDGSNTEAQSDVEQVLQEIANELNNKGYPALLVQLQPHLLAVTMAAMNRVDERAADLLDTLGHHLYIIGEYAAAHPLFQRELLPSERKYLDLTTHPPLPA